MISLRKSGSISVHVMAGGDGGPAGGGGGSLKRLPPGSMPAFDPSGPYLVAAVGVAATTRGRRPSSVASSATTNSIALVFLIPVLFCAAPR